MAKYGQNGYLWQQQKKAPFGAKNDNDDNVALYLPSDQVQYQAVLESTQHFSQHS